MSGELSVKEKVVGLKQVRRAVTQGTARCVYLASDAEERLVEPLRARADAPDEQYRLYPVEPGERKRARRIAFV